MVATSPPPWRSWHYYAHPHVHGTHSGLMRLSHIYIYIYMHSIYMHIVLPTEATGRKLDIIRLVHPRTGTAARFLVDMASDAPHGVYELTKVGTDARSVLIDDRVTSDGSMVVATPLHPLFLVLNVLYAQRSRPLPLDTILDLCSTDETAAVPEEIVQPHLAQVCQDSTTPGLHCLDEAKLKHFLDMRVARVRAGLPPMVRAEVVAAVQPINPGESPTPDLVDAAETYAAVSMVATSWLGLELGQWLLGSYDFSTLEEAAARTKEQHAALLSVQFANGSTAKRSGDEPTAGPPKPAKRAKVSPPKNNTSILDMFKKK